GSRRPILPGGMPATVARGRRCGGGAGTAGVGAAGGGRSGWEGFRTRRRECATRRGAGRDGRLESAVGGGGSAITIRIVHAANEPCAGGQRRDRSGRAPRASGLLE